MSESPEKKNMLVSTQPPTADPQALIGLAEAARPLLNDFLNAQRETSRQAQDHEWRLAELDARRDEVAQGRFYPLVWFGAGFLALVIGFAAWTNRWEIVTHLLTALLGAFSGYGIGHYRYRQAEAQPPDE